MKETDGRYERKFQILTVGVEELRLLIYSHPAFFTEAFPPRIVNNIYFDTPEFDNFVDNIEGSPIRQKARLRWYGDSFPTIESPKLEFKKKIGLLGFKQLIKLKSFTISSSSPIESISEAVRGCFPKDSSQFTPVLLNKYKREYFISADNKFRITIDQNLEYCEINPFKGIWNLIEPEPDLIVMELKYHHSLDGEAGALTNHFPFRVTKSSKYAKGIYFVH